VTLQHGSEKKPERKCYELYGRQQTRKLQAAHHKEHHKHAKFSENHHRNRTSKHPIMFKLLFQHLYEGNWSCLGGTAAGEPHPTLKSLTSRDCARLRRRTCRSSMLELIISAAQSLQQWPSTAISLSTWR
jgi:hypothetical protein